MDFLLEYGLFFAKIVTFVIAVIILLSVIVGLSQKNKQSGHKGHLEITPLNELYDEMSEAIKLAVMDESLHKAEAKKQQKEKMESLLEEFGLTHIRKNRGDLLSGGERRRTEIARALATDPKFVLLDEPFAGVDPVAVEDIQRIVAHLKNKNIGILITDHNVQETLAITDKTYLMFEGGILKAGTPEELASDPMVRKVYLGQNFELRKTKIKF